MIGVFDWLLASSIFSGYIPKRTVSLNFLFVGDLVVLKAVQVAAIVACYYSLALLLTNELTVKPVS